MTTASGDKMDASGSNDEPVNSLPVRCDNCTFPDIDAVPIPYLLCKGISSPIDAYPARLGNFLVRPHVRTALEVAVPGECEFVPTAHWKSGTKLDWWLAVPKKLVRTAEVNKKIRHCPKCAEPRTSHPGLQWILADISRIKGDVFKSLQWKSSESIFEDPPFWANAREKREWPKFPRFQWTRTQLGRDIWFSIRLEQLFKRLGFRGLKRFVECEAKPTAEDLEWVEDTVAKLSSRRISPSSTKPKKVLPTDDWFKQFLKKAKPKSPAPPLDGLRKAKNVPLPKAYAQFIRAMGTRKTFCNVDDIEGYDVRVVGPNGLDTKSYRTGKIECGDDEAIDGLMFAVTGHGDCFCFDLNQNSPNYPVYRFDHERMSFEPYADSFVEAVRRFAGGEE